jgi:hypothetical protein
MIATHLSNPSPVEARFEEAAHRGERPMAFERNERLMMFGACCLALGVVAGVAPAGELEPPPGAIAPTMKDLDDIEPRIVIRNDPDFLSPVVISSPGSYVLGEDIQALGGQHGIEIAASDVTLDLNGFSIVGNLEVGSLDGIFVAEPSPGVDRSNIAISNGVVRYFGRNGVFASDAANSIIQNVRVSDCGLSADGGLGIAAGFGSSVSHCVVSRCRIGTDIFNPRGIGIIVLHGSSISHCSSTENEADGFSVGIGSSAVNCAARLNGEDGFDTGNGVVLADCSARQNVERGIFCPQRCVIKGCTATDNGTHGIETLNDSLVADCVASDNGDDGIRVTNCLVRGNIARTNGGTNINSLGASTLIENY